MTLQDKKVVLTGTFTGASRKALAGQLAAMGAKVSGGVSGKTDYLIAGSAAGSKLYKANEKGVSVLHEPHLKMLLSGTPLEEVAALAETFYTLDFHRGEPPEPTYNVRGGAAPGFDKGRWPREGTRYWDHLFTIDLETAPALKVFYPGKRTLSGFTRDRSEVDMYSLARRFASDVQLYTSTQEAIDAWDGKSIRGKRQEHSGWFTPVAHPASELEEHFGRTRLLGHVPCWIQGEDHRDTFLMQLGEEMSVSGDGLVYFFSDAVFSQVS